MSYKKKDYINLMEKVLTAYSTEQIIGFFDEVKESGLSEHGFPRLTANIGILIAYNKRHDLIDLFIKMMDFCCENIPKVKAANDFSVREIIASINELEKTDFIDSKKISEWNKNLASIIPETCYNAVAKSEDDNVNNWAIFSAVSEYFRTKKGLCDTNEFIDMQLSSQFKRIEEENMYMDNEESDVHQPFVYDLVPRGLFSVLLNEGYHGKYYEKIDNILRYAGLNTLKMQSITGELPFGGRSNQFLHNEAWLAAIFEFEAIRYKKEGNFKLSSIFKKHAGKAIKVIENWLNVTPISHIKNKFPIETQFGCEDYAYFNKYMITTASFLYAALRICDESIEESEDVITSASYLTSYHFHKLFIKKYGYALEFDLNADPHYDASGLGRVHKEGVPSAICISMPCAEKPEYINNLENAFPLSICPGIKENDEYLFATDNESEYKVIEFADNFALIETEIKGKKIKSKYTLSENGIEIIAESDSEFAFLLPALHFDGKDYTDISFKNNTVKINYQGYNCVYKSNGIINESGKLSANRNGLYKSYIVDAENHLNINIEIK